MNKLSRGVFIGCLFCNLVLSAFAQGTAFTYQGRLNASGSPANGSYDLAFTLYATNVTGTALAGPVTNTAVSVTNGLFTTLVDLGNAFTGTSNWLELAVSTNGANAFSPLSPRQQITPTPYALFANSANAAGLTGTIAPTNIANGSISSAMLSPGAVTATNIATGTIGSGQFAPEIGVWTRSGSNIFYNGGNVGVGNDSPVSPLTVGNFGSTNDNFITVATGGGGLYKAGINLKHYDQTYGWTLQSDTPNSAFEFVSYYNQTNGIVRMMIDRFSGNVGIGTTNPVSALQVNGTVTATAFSGDGSGLTSINAANLNGTIPPGQLPSGVITNGASGVNISGTFSGNGGGLTNLNGAGLQAGSVASAQLAAGTLVPPVSLPGQTNSVTPNTLYVITNATATTLQLPTNANVGDGVQITATGAGGWSAFSYNPAPTAWVETSAPQTFWSAVAASADGTHLVAATMAASGIWLSTNSGTSWAQSSAPIGNWVAVASSADGTHLVAADKQTGIWTSTDAGASWQFNSPPYSDWTGLATSADGSHLIATDYGNNIGVWLSTNGGTNWNYVNNSYEFGILDAAAASADGSVLLVGTSNNGLWLSTNSGASWNLTTGVSGTTAVAVSANGNCLVAANGGTAGQLISTNRGATWTTLNCPYGSYAFNSAAVSADGAQIALASTWGIEISRDTGATWNSTQMPTNFWKSVAVSANGNLLIAASAYQPNPGVIGSDAAGWIYTLNKYLTVASGSAGGNTTLQYQGNGVWQATTINAAQLTGTLADSALSANVALRAGGNAFTGNQTITSGNVGIGTTTPNSTLQVAGTVTATGFTGNGSGLTSLNAANLTGRISAANNFPVTLATNLINSAGPLTLSKTFTTHGGTLLISTSGSGTIGSVTAMGMTISLDGTIIETNKIWCNVTSAHMAFVPKTIVKTGVSAASHTLSLSSWNGTTTDANDSFNVTVEELPY